MQWHVGMTLGYGRKATARKAIRKEAAKTWGRDVGMANIFKGILPSFLGCKVKEEKFTFRFARFRNNVTI